MNLQKFLLFLLSGNIAEVVVLGKFRFFPPPSAMSLRLNARN